MKLTIKSPLKRTRRYRRDLREKKSTERTEKMSRRIRLLILCIVLLGLAVIPPVFLNNIFGYLPLFTLALLLVFSYIYVVILKRSLVFEENSDFSNCRRGQESAFTIQVRNRSPLVFTKLEVYFFISDLFGGEDDVTSTVITLSPFEKRNFSFDIRFEHIGTYEAGLNKVVMQDIFGFFQKTLVNEKRYQVQVAPKIYDLEKLHISNRAFTESKNMLKPTSADGTDYTGVREYVLGDPIKTIHWKLSARTNTYMTRQFESYGNMGVSIIMDFQCPYYDRESMMSVFDGVVETALSVEAYGRRNGMEADLLYLNKQGVRRQYITRTTSNPFDLIRDLPKISAEKQKDTALRILREEGNATYAKSNLAYVTGNVTPQLTRTLMDVKARRRNPILFVILPVILTGEERNKYLKPLRNLDYARIPYYVVNTAEELQGGERRVS